MITKEQFTAATGREPQHDDLERCNCEHAGEIGHWFCGWDDKTNLPRFASGRHSEAGEIIRILVRETPFKPTETGIALGVNFDLIINQS